MRGRRQWRRCRYIAHVQKTFPSRARVCACAYGRDDAGIGGIQHSRTLRVRPWQGAGWRCRGGALHRHTRLRRGSRGVFFDEFGLKVTRCISACGSVHVLKVTVCTNAHEESACQWSEPRSIRNPGSTSFGSLTVHAACPLGSLACDISVHGSVHQDWGVTASNTAHENSR